MVQDMPEGYMARSQVERMGWGEAKTWDFVFIRAGGGVPKVPWVPFFIGKCQAEELEISAWEGKGRDTQVAI